MAIHVAEGVATSAGGVVHGVAIAEEFSGTAVGAEPAVSAAGDAKIYMDNTNNLLKVSLNGGAYQAFVTGAGGADSLQTAYNTGQTILTTGTAIGLTKGGAVGVSLLTLADPTLLATGALMSIASTGTRGAGSLLTLANNDAANTANADAAISIAGSNTGSTGPGIEFVGTSTSRNWQRFNTCTGAALTVGAAQGGLRYNDTTGTFQVAIKNNTWLDLQTATAGLTGLQAAYEQDNSVDLTAGVGAGITVANTVPVNAALLTLTQNAATAQNALTTVGPIGITSHAVGSTQLSVSDALASTANLVSFVNSGARTAGELVHIEASRWVSAGTSLVTVAYTGSTALDDYASLMTIGDTGTLDTSGDILAVSAGNATKTGGKVASITNVGGALGASAFADSILWVGDESAGTTTSSIATFYDTGSGAQTNDMVVITNGNAARVSGSLLAIDDGGAANVDHVASVDALAGKNVLGSAFIVTDARAGAKVDAVSFVGSGVKTAGAVLSVTQTGAHTAGGVVAINESAAAAGAAGEILLTTRGAASLSTSSTAAFRDSSTTGGTVLEAATLGAKAGVAATFSVTDSASAVGNTSEMARFILSAVAATGMTAVTVQDNVNVARTVPTMTIGGTNNLLDAASLSLNNTAATTSNWIHFQPGDTSTAPAAGQGGLRFNNAGGVFQVALAGAWTNILTTGGGGGTLDTAYDFGGAGAGRTITADSGPVAIATGTTGNLDITSTTAGQVGIQITSATTANPLVITNTGVSATGNIVVTSTGDTPLLKMTATISAAAISTLIDVQMNEATSNNFSGTLAQFASGDGASGMDTLVATESMTTNENILGNVLKVDGSASTARGTTAGAGAGVSRFVTQGNKPAAGAGANPYSNAVAVFDNATLGQQSWIVFKDTANVYWRLYVSPAGLLTTELC